ncbi:hypothetical protein [Ruminiclostridium papyrosolvens]|uniref:HEPN domain-containing protein n=1 Tax=Ruminiclostridium papyrosolvens C7 TaxID=1330534 RepID=U4QWT1_9FIRM|nr:hypothetical protein [Ruminiclostridium papyrosolvens]EPR07748.1 hypothetical protein L323_19795 [Ruminiclostridium papyrosolvens C7]
MAFEIHIPDGLVANFELLNKNIPDEKEQTKYYNNWMSRYSKIFKSCDENKLIEWTIRTRKSLKEIATSSTFFTEAQFAFQNGIYSAYYFLSYYSLFHAMLSTLYLDDKETVEKLININHSKVINCFSSNFAIGKKPIISFNAREHFETLKFLREYSSYSMPLNEFFMKNKDIINPQEFLEDDLMQCYQLTNFHSIMLKNSYENNKCNLVKTNQNNINYIYELFLKNK